MGMVFTTKELAELPTRHISLEPMLDSSRHSASARVRFHPRSMLSGSDEICGQRMHYIRPLGVSESYAADYPRGPTPPASPALGGASKVGSISVEGETMPVNKVAPQVGK
jgi:hypothetical protein